MFGLPYLPDDGAPFMQHNMVSLLTRASRLASSWPDHVLAVLDNADVVARAVMAPYAASRDQRPLYPDGGWDQIAIWAAEDKLDSIPPDTVCLLEIAVHPAWRGRGLAARTLAEARAWVMAQGFRRLVAPARPPGKSLVPDEPIDSYIMRRREDGQLQDWWLRLHEKAGGTLVRTARCSATVQADLQTWRDWTGLPFDTDSPVHVPGALTPVFVSQRHDLGMYVEPNVWFDHSP